MESINNLFQRAFNQHEAGNFSTAVLLYHELLKMQSGHIDAIYLLGILYLQQGDLDKASEYIQKALLLNPEHSTAHNSLGTVLKKQGKYEQSIESYKRAIVLNPAYAMPHSNLASLYHDIGSLDNAIESYKRAVSLKPDYFEGYINLGAVLQEKGRSNEAVEYYRKAIQINPDLPEAYNNMAVALKEGKMFDKAVKCCLRSLELKADYAEAYINLGLVFQEQGNLEKANESYGKALEIEPDNVTALTNLGSLLTEQRRLDEAIFCCQRAISLRPDYAEAHNNLGVCFQVLGRLEEAASCFEKTLEIEHHHIIAHTNLGMTCMDQGRNEEAVEWCQRAVMLKPESAHLHNNLGASLQRIGKLDEAIINYEKAITLKPDYAEAHMNRAFILLMNENFVEGWSEYEWRLLTRDHSLRTFKKPKWDGSSLNGKSILVHAEQGYGDTIQFVRYLPLIKERGGHVIFECNQDLLCLLQNGVAIDRLVERPAVGVTTVQFDFHVPLLSLPGIFGTDSVTIPSNIPYISLDRERVKRWHSRFVHDKNFKIGLVWAGNPHNRKDRIRSCFLEDFATLADVPGVSFYTLQKGAASDQVTDPPKNMVFNNLEKELYDFAETGAAIANLDLVITVDTAVAHLAGAIGKPVWSLIQVDPDWRWLINREDTPWYPSMRLFRQAQPNDWTSVIQAVKKALIREVA
ncbi:MAG: tetratricopeptide repeat protein [Candidatus Scalindua sp. AMX11]|nr:MAG: tetratricopeptide repeat protein [Candidatus Scalindua sp.]TDE66422.1 MAG: tetratricopeptide repeat protein [Candidatus Scalindua sp. AMX11]